MTYKIIEEARNFLSINTPEQKTMYDEEYERARIKYLADQEFERQMRKGSGNTSPKNFSKGGLKLDNYIDNVEQFWNNQPFFFDKNQIFWLWNKENYHYERTDEIDMMNLIDQELGFGGQTVTGKVKGNYLEAFKRVGRLHIPKEPSKNWIQFKELIVDIKTKEQTKATPEYWIVNSIPWNIGITGETPVMDKLFTDWQGENKEVLYEIISYCMICDYPIHTIFAMVGSGRNGKSQFLKLIETFVGIENITSASLDRITQERFESSKLYKKLVCMMGETNFTTLSKTDQLKKLCSGTDPIDFEFKNKNPFTAHNYAKIIINTNSLPPSTDTTEGFYRRWQVINWNNCFEEGKDIIDTIPINEYNELSFKLINILNKLLDRGNFVTQGNIEERKQKYIMASNPITLFLQERCHINDSYMVKAKDLYHAYINYLQDKKRRIVKRKEFNQLLSEEGYQAEHDKRRIGFSDVWLNSYWIDGLKLKTVEELALFQKGEMITLNSPISLLIPNSSSRGLEQVGNHGEKGEIREVEVSENTIGGQNELILDFDQLSNILLDKVNKSTNIQNLIDFGFTDLQINTWKAQGLLIETKPGIITLL